jgi:antitoxin component of MazEF toxin-antitoxin module
LREEASRTHLVRIGNSLGVRIPKTIIEECGLVEQVDLRVDGGSLIITPVGDPLERGLGERGLGLGHLARGA